MKVSIQKLPHADDLPLPAYATAGSVGLDLIAAVDKDVVLAPGDRAAVPTGISIALPAGYEAQVRPRSGLALKHGLTVLNAPGTIDSDYRGEVTVILANLGHEPYIVSRGMKIAQMIVARVERIEWNETELDETARGAGGFGSTGMKMRI